MFPKTKKDKAGDAVKLAKAGDVIDRAKASTNAAVSQSRDRLGSFGNTGGSL